MRGFGSTMAVLLCFAQIMAPLTNAAPLIPADVCSALKLGFQFLGCLNGESTYCKLFALAFIFHGTSEGIFCDNFLCDGGYGQADFDTECVTSSCASPRSKGICAFGSTCCGREVIAQEKFNQTSF